MTESRKGYTIRLLVVTHVMSDEQVATEDCLIMFEDRETAIAFLEVEVPKLNQEFERWFDIPPNPTISQPITVLECRQAIMPATLAEAADRVRTVLVDGEAAFNEMVGLPPVPDGAELLKDFIKGRKL